MRGNETVFAASTVHLDHVTTALNCLTPFGTKEEIIIFIDAEGLSFARELNHVMRIQLFLSRELFMSYSYEGAGEEQTKVCVKISHLLDSFSVANRNIDDVVECTMSYDGYGSPFLLIFEDSTISERVEYSTYLTQGIDEGGLELDRDQVTFECIIKGDVLYAAMNDLKETGCKECYLYVKSDAHGDHTFAIVSRSQLGLSKIRLPSSKSILEKLEVYDTDFKSLVHDKPIVATFDFSLFDKIRMSVRIASKVLFRMDSHGNLSVNILSQVGDVIVTDSRTAAGRSRTFGSGKQVQLPRDYPGIVVEFNLLEKDHYDEASARELESLMENDELREANRTSKKRPWNSSELREAAIGKKIPAVANDQAHLANMEEKSTDPKKSPFSTNELPMFF